MELLNVKRRRPYKFIDEGEGQPLVVLHGLFGALSNFSGVISHFKDASGCRSDDASLRHAL
jgi:hypothetical protein